MKLFKMSYERNLIKLIGKKVLLHLRDRDNFLFINHKINLSIFKIKNFQGIM